MGALLIMLLVMLPTLIPAIKRQIKKPEFTEADLFEEFVCTDFFVREKYYLTAVPDIVVAADNVFNELNFTQLGNEYEFFIKPKYYTKTNRTEIEYCTKKEFLFFKNEIEIPVYIMLGIGGPCHFPDKLYLIPFKNFSTNTIPVAMLVQYEVKINQDIDFSIY
ncbi:hypothetical protein BEL04_03685 [Mucilaginibacter sp. PPCGB 2223]|uniref:hypothetical protein n=1 Tax=Mucilaginibacter sp. PPCGB 2223 TaxID=1886027 RepID=UPI0008271C55|nr:hypothetical protein [Mucilaginibacter sp. PPCGB 2223]OCX53414.1 hypothetical protein BEL04_03685 [Mucilaginibacter sp. PPCGB 2223]